MLRFLVGCGNQPFKILHRIQPSTFDSVPRVAVTPANPAFLQEAVNIELNELISGDF